MNKNKIIQQIEKDQMSKELPEFGPGDSVVVQVKIKEGDRERLQAFEGVVIGKRSRGLNSSFTVRKISHGVGVERTFQTYSPIVDSVQLKRRGDVRQAKLYYLRELTGRAGVDHWAFYIAFCKFRLAAICQGVYKRGLDGNASSQTALEQLENVERASRAGRQILEAQS